MLEAVLTLLAAAWGAAIHQLVPADQQLAVGVLAFITIAAAYVCQSKTKELSAIGPAVDAAKVVKRPYPIYDISTPEAKKASFKSIIPILIDEACEELEQSYEVRPDEVAWIRYASEYQSFESIDQVQEAIQEHKSTPPPVSGQNELFPPD